MVKDIKSYCQTCPMCWRIKAPRHKLYSEIGKMPKPLGLYRDLEWDFIIDLPPSMSLTTGKLYDCIFVVVCRALKRAFYLPVNKTITAEGVADIFMERLFPHVGTPHSITSDRGSVFISKFWSAMCAHLSIKRRLSTAYHPQTDSQTERQN